MTNSISEISKMGKTAKLTLRLDETLKQRLQVVAKQQERSASFVAEAAIEDYLSFQEAQIRGIEKAIAQLDHGEGVSHAKVGDWVKSLGTNKQLAKPTA